MPVRFLLDDNLSERLGPAHGEGSGEQITWKQRLEDVNIETWFSGRAADDTEYARAAQLVDLTESLADVVVGLRVRARLSQTAAAALAGTTQATISLIENGDADPRADTISRVLNALMARAFAAIPVIPS